MSPSESQEQAPDTFYIIDNVESGTLELDIAPPGKKPYKQLHKMLYLTTTDAANGTVKTLLVTGNPEKLAEIIVRTFAVLSLDQGNDVPSMLRRWADNMDMVTMMTVEGNQE